MLLAKSAIKKGFPREAFFTTVEAKNYSSALW